VARGAVWREKAVKMIELNLRNRDPQLYGSRRYIRVQREGWLYDAPTTGEMELFRVGVLAEAVDRSVDTLVDWESEALIPIPLFKVHGMRWRLYSAEQIVNIHYLAMARLRGRRYVPRAELGKFFDEIWAVFYLRDVVVREDGVISVNGLRVLAVRPPPGTKRPLAIINA
jgi:hypothetical protein